VGRLRAALCVIPGERVSPPLKVLLAAEILVAYIRVRWWLPRRDIRPIVADIRSRAPVRPARVEPGSDDARVVGARLANAVARTLWVLPTDSRCLSQALVLSQLLVARQIDSTLVIGARSNPDFAAHAWVEHRGVWLLPPEGFLESRLLEI
jgi:hypothetical protein